jgi:hypothetical protein
LIQGELVGSSFLMLFMSVRDIGAGARTILGRPVPIPSYAQLLALIEQLRVENAKLAERVSVRRLGQNSKNSSTTDQ